MLIDQKVKLNDLSIKQKGIFLTDSVNCLNDPLLRHFCHLTKNVVHRSLDGIDDLVPISRHQSLQRVSSYDEGDGFVHRRKKLFHRRTDVISPGQSHRRNLGRTGWSSQLVENVEPTKTQIFFFNFYSLEPRETGNIKLMKTLT
jgi:hypothetical protein